MRLSRAALIVALAATVTVACGKEPEPSAPSGPVDWSASVSVDKNEVQVGEDLTLTLTVTHPADSEGELQPPPSAAFEPFEVIDFETEVVSPVETHLLFRLAAYRLPESLEVPALEVRYRDAAGEIQVLTTEPMPVELVTSLTPDVTDIHDIKDPVALTVPRDLSLLWWLLLALAVALVAYLIYRKLRKAPGIETHISVPPPPPAHLEAEAALRRLAEKKLVEQGLMPAFFEELSEIMKRYAGRRFEVPYLERTTHEILDDLEREGRPKREELRAILEASDLVKFARLAPGPDRATSAFELAERYLADTRPKLEGGPGEPAKPDEEDETEVEVVAS